MDLPLKHNVSNILVYSLNSAQINYLGELMDSKFNLYDRSGYGKTIPIPQQTAADTLLEFFNTEEDVIHMFTILLQREGERFYNRELIIYNRDKFIHFLEKRKWIYDADLIQFLRDPFYEHEINFLKKIRILDLREKTDIKKLIEQISKVCETLGDKDLEWRINLRLYDLDRENSELIRKIIEMLLVRQNLKTVAFEMFTCFKELAINASKANYKLLFEKYIAAPKGVTTKHNYFHFLTLFKEEIMEHGNERLLELAKKSDQYINVTFQSTNEDIEIWVTNSQNISAVEKESIMKRLNKKDDAMSFLDDDETEGAGLGLTLILNMLEKYTEDETPLKVIFYPNFIKIGFMINRKILFNTINSNDTDEQEG